MSNTKIAIISPNMNGINDGVNRVQPGHNVGLLSAILQKKGYDVSFRDTALEGYDNQILHSDGITITIGETDEQISSWLSTVNPDYVLISVLFSNLAEHAWNSAKLAKKSNPSCTVLVGGNHVSNAISDFAFYQKFPNTMYRNTIKFLELDYIDFGMWGECDNALPEFIKKHSNNESIIDQSAFFWASSRGKNISNTFITFARMKTAYLKIGFHIE